MKKMLAVNNFLANEALFAIEQKSKAMEDMTH